MTFWHSITHLQLQKRHLVVILMILLKCSPERSKLLSDLESIHFNLPFFIIYANHELIITIEIIQIYDFLWLASSSPFPYLYNQQLQSYWHDLQLVLHLLCSRKKDASTAFHLRKTKQIRLSDKNHNGSWVMGIRL